MRFLVPLTLLIIGCSQAIRLGKCPDLQTVTNFDPSLYIGTWYEIESYGNFFERIKNKCPKATYTSEGGNHILIKNQGISKWSGKPNEFNAVAVPEGDITNGKLTLSFKGPFGRNITGPYWVVDTDYSNFAVVWSCVQYLGFYSDQSWILTRERTEPIPEALSSVVDEVLKKVNIPRSRYVKAKQTNCTN